MKTPRFVALMLALAPSAALAQTQVVVPVRPAGDRPILRVTLRVQLDAAPTAASPVTFTLTDPKGDGPIDVGGSPVALAGSAGASVINAFYPPPPGTTRADQVTMVSPDDTLPEDDPGRRRFLLALNLQSNYDATCNPTLSTPEPNFQLSASGYTIASVCVLSYVQVSGSGSCDSVELAPPTSSAGSPGDRGWASVAGGADATGQLCAGARPSVDGMLVLDRSGSMGGTMGSGGRPKIEALHEAVGDFAAQWRALREPACTVDTNCSTVTGETCIGGRCGVAPPSGGCFPGTIVVDGRCVPGDRLGVVFFSSSAADLDALGGPFAGLGGLQPLASMVGPLVSSIDTLTSSGMTSIGAGLRLGESHFGPTTARRTMLLMSDGKQNRSPLVSADPAAGTLTLSTGPQLSQPDKLRIHSVTLGALAVTSHSVNQDIALAGGGGSYQNEVDDAAALRVHFSNTLDDALRFDTFQTVLLGSEPSFGRSTPFDETFTLSTTTRAAVVGVMWRDPEGLPVKVVLTPPSGSATTRTLERTSFFPVDRLMPGGWRLQVLSRTARTVDLDVRVVADDTAVRAVARALPGPYAPGDQIELQAALSSFGEPILGASVSVGSSKPVEGIGEVLSGFAPTLRQPSTLAPVGRQGAGTGTVASTGPVGRHGPSTPGGAPDGVRLGSPTWPIGGPAPVGASLGPAGVAPAIPRPQPHGTDLLSSSSLAVHLLQQARPTALARTRSMFELRDDGQGADETAADGIYSGRVLATSEGHFDFRFEISGSSKHGGAFTRVEEVTVFVEPTCDDVRIEQSTATQPGGGGTVMMTFTPVTPREEKLGPFWAPFFILQRRDTNDYFRFSDNLDGTYSASLSYDGDTPPQVDVYFATECPNLDGSEPIARVRAECSPKKVSGKKDGRRCSCRRTPQAHSRSDLLPGALAFLVIGLLRRLRRR